MTLSSTWRRAVAPVRRDGLPTPLCRRGKRTDGMGRVHHLRAFQFDGSECMTCPLRSQCISAKGRKGRWVLIHPQEALLQEARALQQSAGYDEYRARRVVVEHRLPRLVHLGIRQSRYFGRVKTRFQLYLAAHGGQPDPGGGQGRPAGRHRRRLQCRQLPAHKGHPFRP